MGIATPQVSMFYIGRTMKGILIFNAFIVRATSIYMAGMKDFVAGSWPALSFFVEAINCHFIEIPLLLFIIRS